MLKYPSQTVLLQAFFENHLIFWCLFGFLCIFLHTWFQGKSFSLWLYSVALYYVSHLSKMSCWCWNLSCKTSPILLAHQPNHTSSACKYFIPPYYPQLLSSTQHEKQHFNHISVSQSSTHTVHSASTRCCEQPAGLYFLQTKHIQK